MQNPLPLFSILTTTTGFLVGYVMNQLSFNIPKILTKPSLSCLALAFCGALLSLLITQHFGYHIATAATLILTWGLLLLACIDFKYYLLPDCLTLPLLWLGLFCNTFELFVPTHLAIWGAMIGYLSLWLIARIFKYLRGVDGLGEGDFKLFALFGAWWGFTPLPAILMIASISGVFFGCIQILHGRYSFKKQLAFGPYLIMGAFVFLFFPAEIFHFFYSL